MTHGYGFGRGTESHTITKETPIICGNCKQDTGMKYEHFTNYLLTDDVKCPRCGEVLISITYTTC